MAKSFSKKDFLMDILLPRSSIASLKQLADKKGIVITNDIPQGSRIFADINLYGESFT